MSKQLVANFFGFASLACTLWVGFGLYQARDLSHFIDLPLWLMIEAVGFLLSVVAAALRPKLWWIALPVPPLTVLFIMDVIGT